jgi:hypothetical protein
MESGACFEPMFSLLSGMEVVTVLAIAVVLFVGKHLNDFRRGFSRGRLLRDRIDQIGEEAGRRAGYNYAKPVYEAITHDNNTVEFHDPRELRPIVFRIWRLAKRAVKTLGTRLRIVVEKSFGRI